MKGIKEDYDCVKSFEDTESFNTTELAYYYHKVNAEFVSAMSQIKNIVNSSKVTREDIDVLKSLDISYNVPSQIQSSKSILGNEIKKVLLEATLSESYNTSQMFYGDTNFLLWKDRQNFYCMKFILYDVEIDFMIEFIRELKRNLTYLYLDFKKFVYSSAVLSFDDFYRFSEIASIADEENDIIKRKGVYLNAIKDSDHLKLTERFDEEDDKLYLVFKNQCEKAIDKIDFELLDIPNQ